MFNIFKSDKSKDRLRERGWTEESNGFTKQEGKASATLHRTGKKWVGYISPKEFPGCERFDGELLYCDIDLMEYKLTQKNELLNED